MEISALNSFASQARTLLLREVAARLSVVLSDSSAARVEAPGAVAALERAVSDAGGGEAGRASMVDRVAYTWFNRVVALRFMDASGFTSVGVVSPPMGRTSGQPAVLADAKAGHIDADFVPQAIAARVVALLGGQLTSRDPQGEAYGLLLMAYCRHWNKVMPFMFEADADYTELLMPADLLSEDSVMARAVTAMSPEVCEDVEAIGWLYQFYIADRKDEVFAGFKKNKKAGPAELPAATQLFTPHWIVRYLVENSLGRLWLLNHPKSKLQDQMEYFVVPREEETGFLKVSSPEELKVIDPACGSGHMLTFAFDLLYAIYEEEGYPPGEIPGLILRHNLYGTEIDPRAGSLAAFALTMKARQRQRTFFANTVQPNICVLVPIHFTLDELDGLVTPGGSREDEEAFLNQFENADTFGALIRPGETFIGAVKTHLALHPPADLLAHSAHARAERVVKQAEYLSQEYHVLVANPPYMGSKNMNSKLSEFARRNYPESKSDLFAMFIERSTDLVRTNGYVGMITMQSWMFLGRYEQFRRSLISSKRLCLAAHFGTRAFETIGGEVVSTVAFILQNSHSSGLGTYLRLTAFDSAKRKESVLRSLSSAPSGPNVFRSDAEDFLAIPAAPIAYWASSALRQSFETGKRVEDVAPVRQGFQTGDNDRYMRFWWEVSQSKIGRNSQSTEEFHAAGFKYAPYLKGGPWRKWFGNDEYVVAFDSDNYGQLAKLGNKLPSRNRYFSDSITWSALGGEFGARMVGPGSTFSAKGACAFPNSKADGLFVLALYNSSVVRELLEFMGATLDFNVGPLRNIPLPADVSPAEMEQILENVTRLIEIHQADWVSNETAPGYQQDDLHAASSVHGMLKERVDSLETHWRDQTGEVLDLEGSNNRLMRAAYGLDAEDGLDGRIVTTLHNNEPIEDPSVTRIERFISYAVGCMFGRYSIDKPGLLLASQGATLSEYLERVPLTSFVPDADNVIPITDGEWFEDDIVSRFRQFLRIAFGDECFEENLRFIEESLGNDVRSYFLKDFYKDHVKRYKKRPIYWLFSSPKGSFNALIYMHRYTPSTVSTVLNEYLREFQAKLAAELASKERDSIAAADTKSRNAAAKETDRLRKVLVELKDYEHDVLYPLASRQVNIDLDDGVKENYPKFGTALKKIIGLESAGE